jgi:hypothetical protein
MTTENDQTDDGSGTGSTADSMAGVAMPDTDGMDTTMAAGPASGAAGVANAELGTSGPPAQDLLTPEELAQTEVIGGAGLAPESIDAEQLEGYLGPAND